MTVHRTTTMTHSAARSDHPDYRSCSISSSPDVTPTRPRRKPSLSIDTQNAQHAHIQAVDPTQPLLPTTRFHTQVYTLPPSRSHHHPQASVVPSTSPLSPTPQPQDIEYADYHRIMTAKASSGTYIGLLCIALVWLLPIGIIASGGSSEVIVPKVIPETLFGRQSQLQQLQFSVSVDEDGRLDSSLTPLVWDTIKRGEHCLRYRTREYTARSVGSGRGREGIERCRMSAAQIHDVELKPTFCQDLGLWSGIWGHWVIDFGEPDCETTWINFKDEGYQAGSGRHRITATLDRFNPTDNWLIMCSTTPANHHFNGKQLPVPTNCQRTKDTVVGIWDIPDRSCEAVSVPSPS